MVDVQRRRTHARFGHVFFGDAGFAGDVFEGAIFESEDHIGLIFATAQEQLFGAVVQVKCTTAGCLNLIGFDVIMTERQFDFGVAWNAHSIGRNIVGDRRVVKKTHDDKQGHQAHQRKHDDWNPFQIRE